ncbi:FtsQ-type POTRA domain-containing protein [Candidatus Roizmanbacteria bacterium]|nr:FtsQ-type POTRA domain-containing protein [Candidatus Roizmanbacteria bacterium]
MSASSSLKRYLNKIIRWLFFVLLCATAFSGLYFLNDSIKIKKIELINSRSNVLGLEEMKKTSLIFLNEKETADFLTKKNPLISKVTIEKKYPSTLVLKLTYDKGTAVLTVSNGYFYLSEQGKILSKSRKMIDSVPKINFYQKLNFQSYNAGDIISFKDIQNGLYFIKSLSGLNLKVDNLDINGVDVLLFKLNDKKIIFSSAKDKELQIYQLEQIIRQFKIEGKSFKEIDLRYDKPVVRF